MKTLQDWMDNLEIVANEVEIVCQYLTTTTGRPVETLEVRFSPEATARLRERLHGKDHEVVIAELIAERDQARVELRVYKQFMAEMRR